MTHKINVCGIGPGNPDLIVPQVHQLVAASDVVVGGERHLATFNVQGKETLALRNNIPEITQQIKQSSDKRITVLVSGDTGFHSLLQSLLGHFPPNDLNVVPGISSYQYFFAQTGMTYEDAWIGSVHGQQADYLAKVKLFRKVFLLTDKQNSWKHIAQNLSDNQLGTCRMYVGNRLSYPDESIISDIADKLKTEQHNFDLCAVIIINEILQTMTKQPFFITAGIPDSDFVRGDVPMTKQEVRVLSLSKLQLAHGDRVLDIGAGTGSVSVEIARLLPQSPVFAVEHKPKAVELIQQNAAKFGTPNIDVILGNAPQALVPLTGINKVFIGGSGGNLREILDWVANQTASGTRLVMNAVTLETLVTARECLVSPAFDRPEVVQVAVNRIEKIGNSDMFRPESPVFIITTTRL